MRTDCAHVVKPCRIRPVLREDGLAKWLSFDLPNHVTNARSFEAKFKAADSRKERTYLHVLPVRRILFNGTQRWFRYGFFRKSFAVGPVYVTRVPHSLHTNIETECAVISELCTIAAVSSLDLCSKSITSRSVNPAACALESNGSFRRCSSVATNLCKPLIILPRFYPITFLDVCRIFCLWQPFFDYGSIEQNKARRKKPRLGFGMFRHAFGHGLAK
jgi:hypothetical protein